MKKMLLCLMILPITACSKPAMFVHNQCAGTKAKIGMSPEEVLSVCGAPGKINRSQGLGYYHEQWVYSAMSPTDYVYIDEGKVTSMQW